MVFRLVIAVFLAAPTGIFAAELDVSRRGFLIGTGATIVTAVAPKKILLPPGSPPLLEFADPFFNNLHSGGTRIDPAILKQVMDHVLGHSPSVIRYTYPRFATAVFENDVSNARAFDQVKDLLLEKHWEPVSFQESTGRWFDGFARALGRKNFRFLAELIEGKKGEVSRQELRQIIEADEPVCDANLNTPLLDQPVFIQEDDQ
jgi:hypothetical protein